jgi:simple sugar transport system permease protein
MKKSKFHFLFGIFSVLLNFVIALLIGSVFLLLQGEKPLEVFYYLLLEPLTTGSGWIKVLGKTAPYIFTGLSAAVAFRCGLFNIGIEGQMFLGGLGAAVVGIAFEGMPKIIHLPLAIIVAMVIGGGWSALAGWLKIRFHVHEVLSTIMMNYLATSLGSWLLITFFRADGPQAKTPNFFQSSRFTQYFPPNQLNGGLILAVIVTVLVFILIKYLPLGWKIDSVGKNIIASRYCGINSTRVIMMVMALSGMLAALCGAERVLGAFGYMDLGFSAGYGFEGLSIAVIAANNPSGVMLVSLFFGLLNYGGVNLNMMTHVPAEWINSLIAIMLILVASKNGLFTGLYRFITRKLSETAGGNIA